MQDEQERVTAWLDGIAARVAEKLSRQAQDIVKAEIRRNGVLTGRRMIVTIRSTSGTGKGVVQLPLQLD